MEHKIRVKMKKVRIGERNVLRGTCEVFMKKYSTIFL